MIRNQFHRFINFGSIADRDTRARLAGSIYAHLRHDTEKSAGSITGAGSFTTALNQILSYKSLKELCVQDPELAEQLTQDILDFLNKTQQQIYKTESPFAMEHALLQEFEHIQACDFENAWEAVEPFLQETYPQDVLDTEFYAHEFRNALIPKKRISKKRLSFVSVKEHFTEKWYALIAQKQDDWEQELIETQRQQYCDELYRHIDAIKTAQETLDSFSSPLARLWDMSKSQWRKVNFDMLNEYAKRLQRDPALQALADMLGRTHAQEFEEEIFTETVNEPVWIISAGKTDVVGIHESDDISSILPLEAALLADERSQLLFYKKFAEKKLQTFEYQDQTSSYPESGTQIQGRRLKEAAKGPFIICVDTSGSMRGMPETLAKTLCFALLKVALRDKRSCFLISFSTSLETLDLSAVKSTGQDNSLDKLVAFLSMSFYGGTNGVPAIQEALLMLETEAYHKADVVMISDFIMPQLDEQTLMRIKAAKKNKTQFHSLVIGDPGDEAINKDMITEFDNTWVFDAYLPQGY